MGAFMMIRRKKTTIFIDVNDIILVHDLKRMIAGIMKVQPQNQQLYFKEEIMDNMKTLSDCLFSCVTKAESPVTIGLALRMDNGEFEPLEMIPYSSPPELPFGNNQETIDQEPLL